MHSTSNNASIKKRSAYVRIDLAASPLHQFSTCFMISLRAFNRASAHLQPLSGSIIFTFFSFIRRVSHDDRVTLQT